MLVGRDDSRSSFDSRAADAAATAHRVRCLVITKRRQAVELLLCAAELEEEGLYAEAAQHYAVAADAIEERVQQGLASPEASRDARESARRNAVAAWARKRWPAEGILIDQIYVHDADNGEGETVSFGIQRPEAEPHPMWAFARMERNGKIVLAGLSPRLIPPLRAPRARRSRS